MGGYVSCETFTNESMVRRPARAVLSGCWTGPGWWRSGVCGAAVRPAGAAQAVKPALRTRFGPSISRGWWRGANGRRCEPLTVRDKCTRYVLEVRPNAQTETVRACLERLFERNGLPEAIRSDNGAPFASNAGVLGLSKLSAWWVALGIDLERGRPRVSPGQRRTQTLPLRYRT
jgi:hypothetical protein